jgi:hypothetical protein
MTLKLLRLNNITVLPDVSARFLKIFSLGGCLRVLSKQRLHYKRGVDSSYTLSLTQFHVEQISEYKENKG